MEGIRHFHILLVLIFVVHYLVKAFLLLSNVAGLRTYRQKTLVPEMIIATLFLGTGLYMLFNLGMANMGGWFHMKLTLVLLAIPIGIIGYKRENKALGLVSSLIFLYVFGIAWTKSLGVFF